MPSKMADAAQTKKPAGIQTRKRDRIQKKLKKPAGIQKKPCVGSPPSPWMFPDDDEDVGHPRSFPTAVLANQSLRAAASQSPVRSAAILGRASSHANC